MKRLGRCAFALAVVGAAGCLLGSARLDARSPREAVIQVEQRWLANENSPAVLQAILADDFVHVLPQGLINKSQHIAYVRAHPSAPDAMKRFEMLRVRVYGAVAIANGVVAVTPRAGGEPRRTMFTDVFALRAGRWQAVNAQETPAAP